MCVCVCVRVCVRVCVYVCVSCIVGRDATEAFEDVGHSPDARELQKKYLIGTVSGPRKALVEVNSICLIIGWEMKWEGWKVRWEGWEVGGLGGGRVGR